MVPDLPFSVILPRHGYTVPEKIFQDGLDYLENLQHGADLLYPELY